MASQTTLGIAIERHRFSESSQVVHFLTRDFGRLVCLARGSYRPKSGLRGGIDLLTLNRISFTRSRGSSMPLLSGRKLLEEYPSLHRRLDAFAHAALVAELMRRGVAERQTVRGLFDLAVRVMQILEEGEAEAWRAAFLFQGAFLRLLGYEPVLDRCVECGARPAPGSRLSVFPLRGGAVCLACRRDDGEGLSIGWRAVEFLRTCIRGDASTLEERAPSPERIREMWDFFALFFQYCLERRILSYGFIKQVESWPA